MLFSSVFLMPRQPSAPTHIPLSGPRLGHLAQPQSTSYAKLWEKRSAPARQWRSTGIQPDMDWNDWKVTACYLPFGLAVAWPKPP